MFINSLKDDALIPRACKGIKWALGSSSIIQHIFMKCLLLLHAGHMDEQNTIPALNIPML